MPLALRDNRPGPCLGCASRMVVLGLALLLAACRRTGPISTTPTASTAAVTPAAGTTAALPTSGVTAGAPAATPAATPSPTAVPRIFTLGVPQAPGTLDPAEALDETALMITRHLYEGLVAFEPGTTHVVPALAASWDVSANGLMWTFHLRVGVRFSDGASFDAQAARLNFERWWRASPPGRYVFWRALFGGFAGEAGPDGQPLSSLARVEAPDPSTLTLTLARPDAALPNSLALPSFAFVSPVVLSAGRPDVDLNQASAGTGRYVLAGRTQADLVRLERNPAYWAGAAGPDQLVFKVIPDDTQRLLALQSGEIEGMAHLNPADYPAVSAPSSTTRLEFDPALDVVYLGLNEAHQPWQNLDCRLAVAYALDRGRYLQQAFPGDADPAQGFLPPGVRPEGQPPPPAYPHDPAQANLHWQTCLSAGVTVPVTVTLYVPPIERPYMPDPAALGSAVQEDLAMLGLDVVIASPDWQAAWLPQVHSGQADLFLLGWTGVNGDPDSFLCPLFCGAEAAFDSDGAGAPVPPDADLAALLEQARTTIDGASRADLYARAEQRLYETVPALPLAYRKTAWAYRQNVRGNIPSPIESVFFDLRWEP